MAAAVAEGVAEGGTLAEYTETLPDTVRLCRMMVVFHELHDVPSSLLEENRAAGSGSDTDGEGPGGGEEDEEERRRRRRQKRRKERRRRRSGGGAGRRRDTDSDTSKVGRLEVALLANSTPANNGIEGGGREDEGTVASTKASPGAEQNLQSEEKKEGAHHGDVDDGKADGGNDGDGKKKEDEEEDADDDYGDSDFEDDFEDDDDGDGDGDGDKDGATGGDRDGNSAESAEAKLATSGDALSPTARSHASSGSASRSPSPSRRSRSRSRSPPSRAYSRGMSSDSDSQDSMGSRDRRSGSETGSSSYSSSCSGGGSGGREGRRGHTRGKRYGRHDRHGTSSSRGRRGSPGKRQRGEEPVQRSFYLEYTLLGHKVTLPLDVTREKLVMNKNEGLVFPLRRLKIFSFFIPPPEHAASTAAAGAASATGAAGAAATTGAAQHERDPIFKGSPKKGDGGVLSKGINRYLDHQKVLTISFMEAYPRRPQGDTGVADASMGARSGGKGRRDPVHEMPRFQTTKRGGSRKLGEAKIPLSHFRESLMISRHDAFAPLGLDLGACSLRATVCLDRSPHLTQTSALMAGGAPLCPWQGLYMPPDSFFPHLALPKEWIAILAPPNTGPFALKDVEAEVQKARDQRLDYARQLVPAIIKRMARSLLWQGWSKWFASTGMAAFRMKLRIAAKLESPSDAPSVWCLTMQVQSAHNLRSLDPESAWYVSYDAFGIDVRTPDVHDTRRDALGGSCVPFNHTRKFYVRCPLASLQRHFAAHPALKVSVCLRKPNLRGRYHCSLRRAFEAADRTMGADADDGCMPVNNLLHTLETIPEVARALLPSGTVQKQSSSSAAMASLLSPSAIIEEEDEEDEEGEEDDEDVEDQFQASLRILHQLSSERHAAIIHDAVQVHIRRLRKQRKHKDARAARIKEREAREATEAREAREARGRARSSSPVGGMGGTGTGTGAGSAASPAFPEVEGQTKNSTKKLFVSVSAVHESVTSTEFQHIGLRAIRLWVLFASAMRLSTNDKGDGGNSSDPMRGGAHTGGIHVLQGGRGSIHQLGGVVDEEDDGEEDGEGGRSGVAAATAMDGSTTDEDTESDDDTDHNEPVSGGAAAATILGDVLEGSVDGSPAMHRTPTQAGRGVAVGGVSSPISPAPQTRRGRRMSRLTSPLKGRSGGLSAEVTRQRQDFARGFEAAELYLKNARVPARALLEVLEARHSHSLTSSAACPHDVLGDVGGTFAPSANIERLRFANAVHAINGGDATTSRGPNYSITWPEFLVRCLSTSKAGGGSRTSIQMTPIQMARARMTQMQLKQQEMGIQSWELLKEAINPHASQSSSGISRPTSFAGFASGSGGGGGSMAKDLMHVLRDATDMGEGEALCACSVDMNTLCTSSTIDGTWRKRGGTYVTYVCLCVYLCTGCVYVCVHCSSVREFPMPEDTCLKTHA